MKEIRTPLPIKAVMKQINMNSVEAFTFNGITYYSLYNVDKDGEILPEGLPSICYLDKETPKLMDPSEAIKLLSKIKEQ